MDKKALILLLLVVVVGITTTSQMVLASRQDTQARYLLREKKRELKQVKQSLIQIKNLMRADEHYDDSLRDAHYHSDQKSIKDQLTLVQHQIQYQVKILNKLCKDFDGPNCNLTKTESKTSYTTITYDFNQMSENIVLNYKLSNGTVLRTCKEYLNNDPSLLNGVYYIRPFKNQNEFPVYCDMTNGGYILFQRRIDNHVNFYKNWNEYVEGFGNVTSSYWLGLSKISKLTHMFSSELMVTVYWGEKSNFYSGKYSKFRVGPESTQFTLSVSGFNNGNITDSLIHNQNCYKFSTKDRINSPTSENCAITYKGAWWYSNCHVSNLNGPYLKGYHETFADGMEWNSLSGYHYRLEMSAMGIREK